jgi:hypothetical protein
MMLARTFCPHDSASRPCSFSNPNPEKKPNAGQKNSEATFLNLSLPSTGVRFPFLVVSPGRTKVKKRKKKWGGGALAGCTDHSAILALQSGLENGGYSFSHFGVATYMA